MATELPAAGHHTSEYTNGELKALIAPVIGVDPDQIEAVAVIADLGDRFTFGGVPDPTMAKIVLVNAIVSGLLEA